MTSAILRTIGLTKRFGKLTAVNALYLEIPPGGIFGFLGPNGAGKTTALRMMCGLLKPDAGQVLIQDRPIRVGGAELRAKIGVCPQNSVCWERLTCLEQLQFMGVMYGVARSEARRRGNKLLEELDLVDKRDQQARTLSGGMRRRLNLALALVHEPEIVILDEPEAGLDPQSRVRVREYILGLAHTKTIILTTHNMDEADRVVDRLAIIDHGALLVVDTPAALKQQVGPGDVVEIKLTDAPDGEALERVCRQLGEEVGTASYSSAGRSITLRALHAAARLPIILEALNSVGIAPGEVSLRPNSLEDVFIQLTGRSLRE